MSTTAILTIVILYEVLSIGGVSLFLVMKGKKQKKVKGGEGDDFITSGRSLPWPIVGCSLALAVLGAVHVFGIMEYSYYNGAIGIWFSVAHVTLLCVICLATGRWIRRTKVATVPQLIGKLYGDKIALICTSIIALQTFAILTMEVQALGIIFNILLQGKVSIQTGALIGTIIGIAYVIFAGMKEIGWVNLINTIVMYIGLIIAAVFLVTGIGADSTSGFFGGGGFDGVKEYFLNEGQEYMTSIFGKGTNLFVTFGLANVIAVTFAQGISQMGLSSATAAKNEKTIVKALWVAAPVNGLFGIFTMAIGIAARSMVDIGTLVVESTDQIAKTAGATMLIQNLPGWLVAWLMAAFLGAVLSTFAITTMSMGSLFVKNIYVLKDPAASEKKQTNIIRLFIVLFGFLALAISSSLPEIVNGANWAFAWLCPVFWNVIYGLFWKRSKTACAAVFACCWAVVLLWTFTPLPIALGISGIPIPFVSLGISIVLGVILNAVLPGDIPYLKQLKLEKVNQA